MTMTEAPLLKPEDGPKCVLPVALHATRYSQDPESITLAALVLAVVPGELARRARIAVPRRREPNVSARDLWGR